VEATLGRLGCGVSNGVLLWLAARIRVSFLSVLQGMTVVGESCPSAVYVAVSGTPLTPWGISVWWLSDFLLPCGLRAA
jgi:hypothetical protein